MAIDASIYSNLKPIEAPNVGDAMQKGMTLANLGMQNQQMQYQMQAQQAMRDAFAKNVGPDGQINRQGALSDLTRAGFGQQAIQLGKTITEQDKLQAEAQKAQQDAYQAKQMDIANHLNYLATVPEGQKPTVYTHLRNNLIQNGHDPNEIPENYDKGLVDFATHLSQQSSPYLNNQLTQANTQKSLAEANKTRSETYAKPTNIANITDPAQLVPSYVPKDHQAAVMEQIKTAEDTKSLTPKILAAFDKGSSRNPVVAAQGQREFEGLINTTVKDTEGTARQAAFDSIHRTMTPSGLTASPGENATKRRTVLEYLQSKQSAPMARGYGIDLSKFDSTSPYQDKPVEETPGGQDGDFVAGAKNLASKVMGLGGGKNANASTQKPAPHGNVLKQGGFTYTWNPQTGKYE